MKVALICFDNPFLKPMEGGKKGMLTRIRSLMEMDEVRVDLYLLNKRSEGIASDFGGVETWANAIHQYPMNAAADGMVSMYPVCVNKRYVRECAVEIAKTEYDVALYEGEHMMKYRTQNRVRAKKHILYMHDIESAYRMEMARSEKSPVRKLAQALEAARFVWLEKKIDTLFDKVLFVSCEERDKLAAKSRNAGDYRYVPMPSTDIADTPLIGERPKKILYVGDMTLPNNYESVKWFAEKAWPLIRARHPESTFDIIGRISREDAAALQSIAGVNPLGYVDDLDRAYREVSLVASPVLRGAGVKVKVIDAVAQGQIVVANRKAIEGTRLEPGKHILTGEGAEGLADICAAVLEDRRAHEHIAISGLAFIKTEHSVASQAANLHSAFV